MEEDFHLSQLGDESMHAEVVGYFNYEDIINPD